MIKTKEILENLERYEKFLVYYVAGVLKSLKEDKPEFEAELIDVIKGRIHGLPLDILVRYMDKMPEGRELNQKASRALFGRHQAVLHMAGLAAREAGGETANSPLLRMVETGEIYEKAFACVTLACLGDSRSRDTLREEMERFSRVLRWSVLGILDRTGDPQWVSLFMSRLEDHEPEVVAVCAGALGRSGNPGMAKNLLPLLSHTHEPLVIAVVRALGTMKAQEAVMPLMELSIATKSDRLRATALTALGEIPESKTIPVIAKCLEHHDPRVRANAVTALSRKFSQLQRVDEEVLRRMRRLLDDSEHRVRADAIQGLWELGRIEGLDCIEVMMKENNPFARSSGAYLCGKLKLFQFREQLRGLTADESWNVRKTAAIALLGLGSVGKATLEELSESGSPDQQVCAVMAISLAENANGIERLFSTARSDRDLAELATELLLT
jgi:HEAT repeat protein